MDRTDQLMLLKTSRASLQQQQETLKHVLQELAKQVNELNKLIELYSPASPALVKAVLDVNASVQAQAAASALPTIQLAKPMRTLRTNVPPKLHDRFVWNAEEYAIVNILTPCGPATQACSFRAKLASKVKMPGKPFEFRWERIPAFTIE